MRCVLQRVLQSHVTVNNEIIGSIQGGLLVLVAFHSQDALAILDKASTKLLNLRIFEDDTGKMNRSLIELKKELLVVSQFTLYADTQSGNRPSFTESMPGKEAQIFYDAFLTQLENKGVKPQKGVFGADMKVALINDGPVTLILDF